MPSYDINEEKYVGLSPNLVDKRLIEYYKKKNILDNKYENNGIENGFRDGVFIRISEDKKQLNKEDLKVGNVKIYSADQLDGLSELKMQKFKEKINSDWNIQLTKNSIPQEAELYCFNVGQGDMFLFISSEGHAFIIDIHLTKSNKDKILKDLKDILGNRPVEALILTHRHFDHYAGACLLLKDKNIKVRSIIVNQSFITGKQPNQIDKLLNEANQMGCNISAPTQLNIPDGNTEMYFSFHSGNIDENDNSILLQIYNKNKLYYLTGDMGFNILENEYLKNAYDSVVLKVSHHGSITGTSCYFLCKLTHCINCIFCGICNYRFNRCVAKNLQAFISVGKRNRYKHPHFETRMVLKLMGFDIKQSNQINTLYEKY